MPAHTLPSARSQGEPLTGRFNPKAGAEFVGTLIGASDEHVLLVSDAGYGFFTQIQNLYARGKAGKKILNPPKEARAMAPIPVSEVNNAYLVAATTGGHMLAFPLADLPELTKGKGNKIINIPPKARKDANEKVAGVVVIPEGGKFLVWSGKRYLRIKWGDLEHYQGERAKRGLKLPRGFQKVDALELDS